MASLSERLGSLSKDAKKKDEAKEDDEKAETFASEEYSLTKSVIIQRDERGYGLTVSGDNPVFVQSVKENGASARAGVQKGDRILKVNGTLVTKCNHKEVVKLIKSGSYVALTLLGRPSGSQATPSQTGPPPPNNPLISSPIPQSPMGGGGGVSSPDVSSPGSVPTTPGSQAEKTAISGPTAVNPQMDKELKMQKMSMIRFMYEKECEECERLTEELRQNPHSHTVQQKLEEKLRVRGRLGDQLYQLTGIPAESHISSPKSPPSGLPPPGGTFSTPPGPQRATMKRYGSGDGLHYITEDKENTPREDGGATDNSWMPPGPKHSKTKSMPEAFYTADLPPSGKNVTVSRSNSDSTRQRGGEQTSGDAKDGSGSASSEDTEKLRSSSLPSSETVAMDQSTNQNAFSSPTQVQESWEEDVGEIPVSPNTDSLNATRVPVSGVSPPREIRSNLQVVSPLQADVIPMEEEEEVNMDDEHLEDHGPFSDLNRLKHKPAHLAVFLYYLISNSDPSPMLFYLVTEHYTTGSMKDLRRWAYEIYSTFLVQEAAIKVEDLDESLVTNIEQTLLLRSDKEDVMRTVFQNVRHITQKQISELLADFRQKRTLGLANLYGDNELSDNMDRAAELKIVESKLLPHLEKCTRETEKSSPRDKAMAWALATIMKQLGVTPTKTSNALERCQSFISKDKKAFKLGGRSSKKNGHQFNPTHYHSTVYCSHCKTVLWGIGYQGFQCSNCEINLHKSCMEQSTEVCSGRKRKEKRTSMLNILRKTTNPNPAAIHEARRIHEDSTIGSAPSHIGSAPSHVTPPTKDNTLYQIRAGNEEEEELEALRANGSKVTNLVEQYSQLQGTNDARSPGTPPRGHSPDNMETDEQKRKNSATSNLGRSESLNKKKESRRSVRRTRSDVQVDDQTLKSLNQSGSSSNSSLSNRSLDSPSASAETLSDNHHPQLAVLQEDSDFETEPELPPLEVIIPKDQLKKLKKSEKKRQEVINELFYTERAHVRDLKVIDKIFRVPMTNSSHINDPEMISLLFTGIEDLVEVHSKLNNRFKNTRKESCVVGKVADLLLSSFDGEAGEQFKKSAAAFCRDQSHALDYLRARQRKDEKLANFIREAASNPLCRRLELKDIIPKAMQRLTKYPLLIDSLLKDTPKSSEDHPLLQRAAQCSRDILNYVNQAVKERENEHKLADMQKRLEKRGLDNTHYQNFDLRNFKLIHDGLLTWRISKQKQINLHVLLLSEYLVLLQKQDDRLILKPQSTGRVPDDNYKMTHSPIIKLSKLMVRPVATDKYAIFLISDGEVGPQIYELVGTTVDSMKKWIKYLSEGTSEHRQKKGKGSERGGGTSSSFPTRPVSMVAPDTTSSHLVRDSDTTAMASDHDEKTGRESPVYPKSKSHSLDNLDKIEHVEVHNVTDTVLAQPCEVVAQTVQVNTATPTLTPNDRLREQEDLITHALEEKRNIIAEIMGIPAADFTHISEMAAELSGTKEPRELIVSTLHHSEQLTCLVNSCFTESTPERATSPSPTAVGQGDVVNNNSVTATGNQNSQESEERTLTDNNTSESGGGAGSPAMTESTNHNTDNRSSSGSSKDDSFCVPVPSRQLLDITAKLTADLHRLMEACVLRDRDNDRMQMEIRQLHSQVDRLLEGRGGTVVGSAHDAEDTAAITDTGSRPHSYISNSSMTGSVSSSSEIAADQILVSSPGAVSGSEEVSLNQVVLQENDHVVDDEGRLSPGVATMDNDEGGRESPMDGTESAVLQDDNQDSVPNVNPDAGAVCSHKTIVLASTTDDADPGISEQTGGDSSVSTPEEEEKFEDATTGDMAEDRTPSPYSTPEAASPTHGPAPSQPSDISELEDDDTRPEPAH